MISESTKPHVIRTVRIPSSLDTELRKVARENKSSVNSIAEGALTKFVEFDQFSQDFDYVVVPKTLLVKAAQYLTQTQIKEFGEWAAKGPGSDTVQFYGKSKSLNAVLNTFEGIGARYSRLFAFHHETDGKDHTITLNHGMGMKWSLFYGANLKKIFKELLDMKIETQLTENVVVGHFSET